MASWITYELPNVKPTLNFLELLISSGATGEVRKFDYSEKGERNIILTISLTIPEEKYSQCQDTAIDNMLASIKDKSDGNN